MGLSRNSLVDLKSVLVEIRLLGVYLQIVDPNELRLEFAACCINRSLYPVLKFNDYPVHNTSNCFAVFDEIICML
jgi:hypothetical protein